MTPEEPTIPPPSDQPDPNAQVPEVTNHRRNGKVARLPKVLRDRINNCLLDGLTYKQVIAELGDDGKHLNEDNVGNWVTGGYTEWLKQQVCLDEWRFKWEFAHDLVDTGQGLNIHQMVNQTLANLVHEAVSDLPPDALTGVLKEKPENILQLLQVFPRLTEAEVQCARHRAETLRNQLKSTESKRGKRILQPDTHKEIEQRLNLR
jgi:hypothetical protein